MRSLVAQGKISDYNKTLHWPSHLERMGGGSCFELLETAANKHHHHRQKQKAANINHICCLIHGRKQPCRGRLMFLFFEHFRKRTLFFHYAPLLF